MKKNIKLLFIHGEEKLKIDEGGNCYTDGSYNDEVWKRYINISDDLTVVFREDTTIYTTKEAKKKFNCVSNKNIKFIKLNNIMSSVKSYINIKTRIHNRIILRELIRNSDLIIIRIPSYSASITMKYIKKFNKEHIVEVVGCPWDSLWNHSLKGKIIAPVMYLKTKRIIKNSNNVLYVSRRFLQDRYPTKGYGVGCPDVVLDEPHLEVLNKRLEFINNKKEGFTLGLIGSLDVNYRGHETVIKALSELNKRKIYCKVKFLGQGEKERWQVLAKEYKVDNQIKYCGTLPSGEAVFNWIDKIDILTMPTQQETLGRAIIEAMSRGCPVIGSIETAIGEQIGSDCLCKARDYIALADIIERMYNDKEYLEYCARENFYRSFKYSNKQTSCIRTTFYKKILTNLTTIN